MRQRWIIAVFVCALVAPVCVVLFAWICANSAGIKASSSLPERVMSLRRGYGEVAVARADPSFGVRVSVMYGFAVGERPAVLEPWSFWPGLVTDNTITAAAGWPWPSIRWGQVTVMNDQVNYSELPTWVEPDTLVLDGNGQMPPSSEPPQFMGGPFVRNNGDTLTPFHSVYEINRPIAFNLAGIHVRLPWSPYWPGLLANSAVYFVTLLLLSAVAFTALDRRRVRLKRCVRCNYDLRGLTSTKCPECGTPLPTHAQPASSS